MSTGVKVAKPNFDATKAANKNLIFTTDTPSLKIFAARTLYVKFNDPTGLSPRDDTVTISHGLGYVPVYRVFFAAQPATTLDRTTTADSTAKWYMDANTADVLDPANTAACLSSIDKNNIYITIHGYDQNVYQCRIYIFQDRVV